MSRVILKLKEAVVREVPLEKKVTTIGRAHGNDLVIDNPTVSGFHARIVREAGRYFIEDLGSTNGTYLGRQRITKTPLTNHSVITIGVHTLHFSDPSAAEDPEATQRIPKVPSADATMVIPAAPRPAAGHDKTAEIAGAPRPAASAPPQGAPAEQRLGAFAVISGSTDAAKYLLHSRVVTIGKTANAEIKLKALFAPKIAALVNRSREGYYLCPVSGEKRPTINGRPVEAATLLKHLDVVEVAGVQLQFFLKEG